jgi:hypothetical protein
MNTNGMQTEFRKDSNWRFAFCIERKCLTPKRYPIPQNLFRWQQFVQSWGSVLTRTRYDKNYPSGIVCLSKISTSGTNRQFRTPRHILYKMSATLARTVNKNSPLGLFVPKDSVF